MNPDTLALNANPLVPAHLAEARGLARRTFLVLGLGLLPVGGWVAMAPLSSAVVAQAHVKVDLDRRTVQHVEGGIVREVKVRDGQHVQKGDPLIVLGDVAVDADVRRLTYRVFAEQAGMARFEAEQAGLRSIAFPASLLEAAATRPEFAEQIEKERTLFNARRQGLDAQVALLRGQREKIAQEGVSLRAQIDQAAQSLRLQQRDLERHRSLVGEGFISQARISQQEAGIADYGVKLEERRSEFTRAEQRMVEIDLRIQSLAGEYRQQATDQLKMASARLSEVQQELRKWSDAAQRQVIAAPASGEVMNLRYTTPGSVVGPREPVADIVPTDPRLVVEARIRPEDVRRVRIGQASRLRLAAYNPVTTPMVQGQVFYVSADRVVDPSTQAAHYTVMIEADAASLREAGTLALQAGMPVEVFIEGDSRTPLQYLLEPVTLLLHRAGRER